jgi:NADP-dependent alcohol dehydrogenase
MALNGLISTGVPQDWATHMIGHELTALHGIDHAQTLAIVLPSMLRVRKEAKRAKLLQFAERIWDLREGSEDSRIDTAISRMQDYFEQMGVKTRLSDYQLGADDIPPSSPHWKPTACSPSVKNATSRWMSAVRCWN